MTLRTIIARTTRPPAYGTADEAIRASKGIDSRERTVSDAEICDKTVRQVLWSDTALVMELDDGPFLNCVGQNGRVVCSLDDHPAAQAEIIPDDDVRLELDGSIIEWHRTEIASKYPGAALERLWFAGTMVHIYFKNMPILTCHSVESWPEGRTLLFWDESE